MAETPSQSSKIMIAAPSFSAMKARTSAASTSRVTKAWPMPRTRMKVSWPRLTFLSCEIRSIIASTPGQLPPPTALTWVGSPTAARCAMTRSASSLPIRPRRAENSKASDMPSPTASPCSSLSEKPAAASKAWPKVWPRLSSMRSPVSRSSRATMAALARQLTAMACSRAGPPANRSRQLASSHSKNAASPSRPYFTTSA